VVALVGSEWRVVVVDSLRRLSSGHVVCVVCVVCVVVSIIV